MFVKINRHNNVETTINLNQIVNMKVMHCSETDKYVHVTFTSGYIDISMPQYEALLGVMKSICKLQNRKVHTPLKSGGE